MIKSSAMFSAHTLHVLFRNTLISLIVIFIGLFFWLKVGIEADRLVVGDYKIEKLYLKLNKKLTLKAENITIPTGDGTASSLRIDKVFDDIKYFFTLFDKIVLDNILLEKKRYTFSYKDTVLHIGSDEYEVVGKIERKERVLTAKISQFEIKKEHIVCSGNIDYDLRTNQLTAKGGFAAYHIEGRFAVAKLGDNIAFNVRSDSFTDLKTLINTIPMSGTIKSWIVDKVQAKSYRLNSLKGEGRLTDRGVDLDFETLQANMLFKDAKIYYKKGLKPILADSFLLTYKQRGLYFDLKNPTYRGRSLEKSKIAITELGKNANLLLDLHIKSKIDATLQKVLRAYAIKVPLKHQGEVSQLDIKIGIPLGEKRREKMSVKVDVAVGRGLVWYGDIKLPVRKATVVFDNSLKESLYADIVLKKGTLEIGETKLPVLSGKIRYAPKKVTLTDVHIKELWYDTRVDGDINLKSKKADLTLKLKRLTIGEKEKFVVVKDKVLGLNLDYAHNLKATVPSLGLSVTHNKKMTIKLSSLKKIKKYIRNIDIDFNDGNLVITKEGSGSYTFKGVLKRKKCFFYDKSSVCHLRVPCRGTIKGGGLSFYAFNNRLHYSTKKERIKLKNINIDLKKLLDNFVNKRKGKKKSKKLVIIGKNSKIRYEKHLLITDSFDIEISPKGSIKATGSLDGDIVKLRKKGKNFTLNALRIKDKMLHPLLRFKGLKGGKYTLKLSGNLEKVVKGQIMVEGGVMHDFKAYNNTLALINAIPAIATLSRPGFSDKGFKIEQGLAEYRMIGRNRFVFDSIYIKGESATIVGKGEIDIKRNTIHMKLAIQTARELGKLVGSLPLLGYILMGKDQSMTVGLEVTGSLAQPIVKTSAAKEILTLPFELIKRTLQSPTYFIKKLKRL